MHDDALHRGLRGLHRLAGILAVAVAWAVSGPAAAAEDANGRADTAFLLDFGNYIEGSVEDWLEDKGFTFQRDARRRDRFDIDIGPRGLALEARTQIHAIMLDETVNVPDFSTVEIVWGVDQFPAGASYEDHMKNEAIMVIVFLGDERVASGSFLIPDAPYFIGLFLCHDDEVGKPYSGRYFQKGGRYVCLDRPKPGETATSRFDLMEGYRNFFDKERDDNPGVSGLGIAMDTTKSGEGGRARSFVRSIRFLK